MKGYRRILCCCYLLFTFLDSQGLQQRRLSQVNVQFITDPHFHHLPSPQDWSHTWSSRKRSSHDWKTSKESATSLGSELSLSLRKTHLLFPIWINLASSFTYVLHFVLLNKLSLESSIQQFTSFTTGHFFQILTLCFFSLCSPDFPVSLKNMSTRMLCSIPTPCIYVISLLIVRPFFATAQHWILVRHCLSSVTF